MHSPHSLRHIGLACLLGVLLPACEPKAPTPDPAKLAQRVFLLAGKGQLERAEQEVDAAIASVPDDIELHLMRGAIIERSGRFDSARLAYLDAQRTARAQRAHAARSARLHCSAKCPLFSA